MDELQELKEWVEKQINLFSSTDEFSRGNKWGHECVLSKIDRMQKAKTNGSNN